MSALITEIRLARDFCSEAERRWHVAYVRNNRSNFLKVAAQDEKEARQVAALALSIAPTPAT
jgi:Uri superfamily endonuclease